MHVSMFLFAFMVFLLIAYCIGCFLAGRWGFTEKGLGLLLVFVLVIPLSIAFSTGAYYSVLTVLGQEEMKKDEFRRVEPPSFLEEGMKPSPIPKSDSGRWFDPHGNNPEFGSGNSNEKPKIKL